MSNRSISCRLLRDAAASGAWNMAVDEALLESAIAGGDCVLRFYQWDEPTLSLGYFQQYDERFGHAASRQSAVVRRASGGGAIMHDRELTYSLVAPPDSPLAAGRLQLYETLHTALIDVLADRGITAALCDPPPRDNDQRQPFLCFQRRAPGDVLVGDVKIAGSAQRRSRGAVLQHGSVLLARSTDAPELDGLAELAGDLIHPDWLAEAWLDRLTSRLSLAWRETPLCDREHARAERCMAEKYGTTLWTEHRNRPPTALD